MAERITNAALLTAAAWLRENDGQDGEASECAVVADMLEAMVTKREENAMVATLVRRTGSTAAKAREFVRRRT